MTRHIPSLNWLRVFEAAAREESFARAAQTLAMSPSAVSQQVYALEDHLGTPLFIRHARKVELTEAGHAFLPPVRQALHIMGTAAEALFPSAKVEVVTVQAVYLLALSWLPSRIASFETKHPGVRVALSSGNALADFRLDQQSKGPDIQIVFGGSSQLAPGSIPFLAETLSIVARPDVAANISTERLLAGQRLIDVTQHDSGWERMRAALPGEAAHDGILTYVDSTPLAFAFAAQGLGLALERTPASDELRRAFGLVRVRGSPVLQGSEAYHLHLPGTDTPRRAVRQVRDWLMAEATEARKHAQILALKM